VVGGDQQQHARDGAQAGLERVERRDGRRVELARLRAVQVADRVDAIPVQVRIAGLAQRVEQHLDSLVQRPERPQPRAGRRHAVELDGENAAGCRTVDAVPAAARRW